MISDIVCMLLLFPIVFDIFFERIDVPFVIFDVLSKVLEFSVDRVFGYSVRFLADDPTKLAWRDFHGEVSINVR